MHSFLKDTRYYWRELLPRALVIFLCAYLVMPHAPGLAFNGGFKAAAGAALFFTAYFSLWGACIMAAEPVQNFMERLKNPIAAGIFHSTVMVIVPLLAMLIVLLVVPSSLVYTSWYGLLAWIVALHACCFATHDWGWP